MRPLGPYGVIGATLYGDLWGKQVPGVVPAENESGTLGTLFCGYHIMDIILAFQAKDDGSIPSTRSILNPRIS